MKKSIGAVTRIALLVIVAVIIGINIYSLNAARIAGNTGPMPFGIGAAVVLSGSMEPEISVGDLLIVVEKDEYYVNDVVVYQDGRMSVTHRIISVSGDEIITRGDANNTEDSPITRDMIKGRVVLTIPLVGHLVNLIKTPVGTLVFLGLAIWLMERSFRREKARGDDELDKIKAEIQRLKEEQKNNG